MSDSNLTIAVDVQAYGYSVSVFKDDGTMPARFHTISPAGVADIVRMCTRDGVDTRPRSVGVNELAALGRDRGYRDPERWAQLILEGRRRKAERLRRERSARHAAGVCPRCGCPASPQLHRTGS